MVVLWEYIWYPSLLLICNLKPSSRVQIKENIPQADDI